MYKLIVTSRFKKDLKKYKSDSQDIKAVLSILHAGIPIKLKPHKLKGTYNDCWECHIKPDKLIIWIQIENPKEITLIRLGSHSELFN